MALGFLFGVLGWAGACYWNCVGGVMFNSPSSFQQRSDAGKQRVKPFGKIY
jgi:hypothetical protein